MSMSTQEVANQLFELCRKGKWEQAQNELNADHALSVEPEGAPWPVVEGIDLRLSSRRRKSG